MQVTLRNQRHFFSSSNFPTPDSNEFFFVFVLLLLLLLLLLSLSFLLLLFLTTMRRRSKDLENKNTFKNISSVVKDRLQELLLYHKCVVV